MLKLLTNDTESYGHSCFIVVAGIFIINLGKTWDKLQMAARVLVAIENPPDITVQSARPYGQRAVLKFAQYTGAQAIAGRHTPGTFTNQLQNTFSEPRLLVLTDPRVDHQVQNSRLCEYIHIHITYFQNRSILCNKRNVWLVSHEGQGCAHFTNTFF